jgi:hypothetical protein
VIAMSPRWISSRYEDHYLLAIPGPRRCSGYGGHRHPRWSHNTGGIGGP